MSDYTVLFVDNFSVDLEIIFILYRMRESVVNAVSNGSKLSISTLF